MTKASPRLTKIQAKALDFIKSSLDRTGTAPTLRELCSFMGYSAIGSAQDLVAALRRKGFLHTPDKQSARSLVLTPKAIALHEPSHQSTEDTFIMHCIERVESGKDPLEMVEDRIGTLRISIGMFDRPFPDPKSLFAIQANDDGMLEAGILKDDWLVVKRQETFEVGKIAVLSKGDETLIRTVAKDRNGLYFRAENTNYPILRDDSAEAERFACIGVVIALQRVFKA